MADTSYNTGNGRLKATSLKTVLAVTPPVDLNRPAGGKRAGGVLDRPAMVNQYRIAASSRTVARR